METRCKLPFLALDLEARIKGSWNWVQALKQLGYHIYHEKLASGIF